GNAVGGSVVVNVFPEITTRAFVDSDNATHITQLDALGQISVTAQSKLETTNVDTGLTFLNALPDVSSVAAGGGVSGSGTAVTGSVIVDILTINTIASVAAGTQINQHPLGGWSAPGSDQKLTVTANDETHLLNVAGTLSLSGSGSGFGIGLVIDVITKHVEASILGGTADAAGDILVKATSLEDVFAAAVQFSGSASDSAFTGSIIVVLINAVQADDVAHALAAASVAGTVRSDANLNVEASDSSTLTFLAGGLAIGLGGAGVAVSATVLDRFGRVDAAVGAGTVGAEGATGVTVKATQTENHKLFAMGGAGGDSAGVAGSAVVNVTNNHTHAHVAAQVNTSGDPGSHLHVLAENNTDLLAIAGAVGVGGTAGIGAGVDVEVISKDTKAWLAKSADVWTTGDVTVDAHSNETITSISAGGSGGGTVAIALNASVPVINVTTHAYVKDGTSAVDRATVAAGGTVRVEADERLKLNAIGGNISASGSASIGIAAAVPVVTKNTQAWIGNWASVSGLGGGAGLTVRTGQFTVDLQDTRFNGTAANGSEVLELGYAHNFEAGQEVVYDPGEGGSIGGLSAGGLYYVVPESSTAVRLRGSPGTTCNGACITLTPGTGRNNRLVPTDEVGMTSDKAKRFDPQADVSGNTINLPYSLGLGNNDTV
ncbi:MAG TPA: hypothetical protein VGK49_12970, partial [Ilumatobacteraceae bacterium]